MDRRFGVGIRTLERRPWFRNTMWCVSALIHAPVQQFSPSKHQSLPNDSRIGHGSPIRIQDSTLEQRCRFKNTLLCAHASIHAPMQRFCPSKHRNRHRKAKSAADRRFGVGIRTLERRSWFRNTMWCISALIHAPVQQFSPSKPQSLPNNGWIGNGSPIRSWLNRFSKHDLAHQ